MPKRLNSWKEIAAYLDVSVRTVQRWEVAEGLPVERHRHARRSSVYADASVLDRWWHSRPGGPAGAKRPHPRDSVRGPSIAVLPFANLDRDEETEILADGLTEDLITTLSRIPQLRVVARSSVFYFKDKPRDVRDIARRLGVQTVLEGSVRRAGNHLRVTAQLISAADGCHLWADRFDSKIGGPVPIEDRLAQVIATRLRVRLLRRDAASRRSSDLETYNTYLRGQFYWNQRTPHGLHQAVQCFEACIAREADFAAAYAGLANCHTFLWRYGRRPRAEVLPKAQAAVARALEIDPNLGEAHTSLGLVRIGLFEMSAAESAFRRALELNPGDHRARHWRAMALSCLGCTDEAVAEITEALELDPLGFRANQDAGRILFAAGRFQEAAARLRHTLELAPDLDLARIYLALASIQLGDYPEALTISAGAEPALGALVRARTGEPGSAAKLISKWGSEPPSFTWRGALQMAVGEEGRALESFEQGAERFEMEFLELFAGVQVLFPELSSRLEFTRLAGH